MLAYFRFLLIRCFTKMFLNVVNQIGRSTFIVPETSSYGEAYRFSPINSQPGFAFGAMPLTSTFIPLGRDELEINKKMQTADQPTITVLEQDIKTDKKITSADLQVGAGMSSEIDEAFSKPVYKIKEISLKRPAESNPNLQPQLPVTKKPKIESGIVKSGNGSLKRIKKFQGAGLKFS